MFGYIYKTTCSINNKIYIGQKWSSIFLGNKYLGSGLYLKNAIKKYGKANFKVELINFYNTKEELDAAEKYYIDLYDSTDYNIGYNLSSGGYGPDCGGFNGKHHSQETIEKIRQASFISNQKRKERGWVNPTKGKKGHPARNKGKILIIKNNIRKFIDIEDFNKYEVDGWVKAAKEVRKKSFKRIKHKLSVEERANLSGIMIQLMAKYKNKKRDKSIALKANSTKLKNGTLHKVPANVGKKLMYNDFEQIWVSINEIEHYLSIGYTIGRKFGKCCKN